MGHNKQFLYHAWKGTVPEGLVCNQMPGSDGFPGPASEEFQYQQGLYDLRRDRAETYDVSQKYPEIVEELLKVAEQAHEDLSDDLTKRIGKNNRPIGKIE